MKKKIIGVTVGSPLPKPNLKQTDPRKGDYVKGKDIIPSKVSDLENDSGFLTEHQDISGKLDAAKLPEAINTALAQAKNSGEFNGADGEDGKDGYTPQKGIDYFDGKDGQDGKPGEDGYTPKKGVDYFDGQPGKDGYTPVKGVDYFDGKDGKDGRDGVDGKDGSDGYTPVKGKDYFDGEPGKDGQDGQPGKDGQPGAQGQRGTGLLAVTTAPASYTNAVGGITPKYRMSLSTIKTQAGVTEVLLGDTVRSSYYHYPIAYMDASYAYFTTRVSIRGATGAAGAAGTNGTDGKSAYAYAQDAGYTGTEEEFAEKLASESSGIHIGTDAPTDENVNVWIDTDEEAELPPVNPGGSIDVTAEVGQTIIVEEVDGNGKPTKWKAVEYQPRTHYSTYEEVQLLDNVTFIFGDEAFLDFFLVEGQSYRVIHNGTTYEEVAAAFNLDGISGSMIGNPAAVVGDDNGKPYAILTIDGMATQYMSMVGTDDTITLYTNQETIHEIPQKYLPDMRPYYVVISPDLDGDGTKMVTLEKVESFTVALATGRAIIAKVYSNDGGVQFIPLFSAVDSNNILLFNTYGGSATLFANDEGGYNVTVNFG